MNKMHKRKLNPKFIRDWSLLLIIIAIIVVIGISAYFMIHIRTSEEMSYATPDIQDPSAVMELDASSDCTKDDEAATELVVVAELMPEDELVVEEELITLDCQAVLESVDLTVPQGILYDRDWILSFRQQIDDVILAHEVMQEELPEKIRTMRLAYTAMYYLCFDATTDVATEGVTLMLAKTTTAEIGGLDNLHAYSTARAEQAAVDWCILNRVNYGYPDLFTTGTPDSMAEAIWKVTKSPNQFAYCADTKAFEGQEALAIDVLCRWILEGYGLLEDVGRTLPDNYRYFYAQGDGWHNRFHTTWGSEDCEYWNWTLTDPYLSRQLTY